MNFIFNLSRKAGKTRIQDFCAAKVVIADGTVRILGMKTYEEAVRMADRLLKNHSIKVVFTPVYKTPRPTPIIDNSDAELPIIGFQYHEKELVGYDFSLRNS